MRIELGARELSEGKVTLQQRNHAYGERQAMTQDNLVQQASQILTNMHQEYYSKAAKSMQDRTVHFTDLSEFEAYFEQAQPGFATAYYAEDAALEKTLKQKFAVTVRCLPLQQAAQSAPCLFNPSQQGRFAVFAKAY